MVDKNCLLYTSTSKPVSWERLKVLVAVGTVMG